MSKKYLMIFCLFIGIVFLPSIGGLFIYRDSRDFETLIPTPKVNKKDEVIYGDMVNIVLKKTNNDNYDNGSKYCFHGQMDVEGICICNPGWYGNRCNIKKCSEDIYQGKNSLCMYVDVNEFDDIIRIEQYKEIYYYISNIIVFICLCVIVILMIKCFCSCGDKENPDNDRCIDDEDQVICKSCGKSKVCTFCNEKNYQAPPQYGELFENGKSSLY
uniref:EGF-like domain-containing protein n=1 Tax=Strongyloides papillosus TaxID=174720 RepID=A0A0N5C928_STREA